jgi:hypothetical protein
MRIEGLARATGLEPATPGVTGRYSNRLSYARAVLRAKALKPQQGGRDTPDTCCGQGGYAVIVQEIVPITQ